MKLKLKINMEVKKYKLRCRKLGIIVSDNPKNKDVVWKREFNPEIYSIDKLCKDNQ